VEDKQFLFSRGQDRVTICYAEVQELVCSRI